MFEKEAEEKSLEQPFSKDHYYYGFKEGAEFGYKLAHEEIDYLNKHWRSEEERKANEWHFVKDGEYPKEKGNYLVAWERTHHVEEYGKWGFDVDLFNADEGYFEGVGDYVIAWKEIVLPKESK